MELELKPIYLILLVALLGAIGEAQVPKLIDDPLFGISYDPQKVHFERVPPLLSQKCTSVRERYVVAWVYGHFQAADAQYFLVSGLMQSRDEETGALTVAQEEGDGTVVALRSSKCLMDQADYFFSQGVNPAKDATPIMVPKSVLRGVLQDAFKRYSNAFGGREKFVAKVKIGAIAVPIVREQLEIFENHSNSRK